MLQIIEKSIYKSNSYSDIEVVKGFIFTVKLERKTDMLLTSLTLFDLIPTELET